LVKIMGNSRGKKDNPHGTSGGGNWKWKEKKSTEPGGGQKQMAGVIGKGKKVHKKLGGGKAEGPENQTVVPYPKNAGKKCDGEGGDSVLSTRRKRLTYAGKVGEKRAKILGQTLNAGKKTHETKSHPEKKMGESSEDENLSRRIVVKQTRGEKKKLKMAAKA